MLHKKTEYRIQYNKLNQDLRRKIWEDNITARKSQQVSNQATHYWEFQLRSENCECDTGDEEDDHGPLPPNRQKHKALREQYSQKSKSLQPNSSEKDAREMAVQTPEWVGDEPDSRLGVAGTSEEELVRNMSSLTLPEVKDSQSRPVSPTPPKTPSVKQRTARSLSRPTRTNLKLHTEEKKTHFVPFGWNERKTNVGQKQTFNVSAPTKQVHESARQASQRRKAEVERFLAQEKSVTRLSTTTRSRERTISNVSSQWMSEYQEQFSVKSSRCSRPQSAPPAPRPITWRRS